MNCFKHGFCLTTSAHCFGPRPVLQPPNGALGRTEARLRSFLLTAARRPRASRNGLLFDRMNVNVGGWVGECVGAETSLPIRDEQRQMRKAGGSSDPRMCVQCRQGRRHWQSLGELRRRCHGSTARGAAHWQLTRAPAMALLADRGRPAAGCRGAARRHWQRREARHPPTRRLGAEKPLRHYQRQRRGQYGGRTAHAAPPRPPG